MISWLMSVPPACRRHEPTAISNSYHLLNAYYALGIIQAVAPLIFAIALSSSYWFPFIDKET